MNNPNDYWDVLSVPSIHFNQPAKYLERTHLNGMHPLLLASVTPVFFLPRQLKNVGCFLLHMHHFGDLIKLLLNFKQKKVTNDLHTL